jgi:YHS domain-containing protein
MVRFLKYLLLLGLALFVRSFLRTLLSGMRQAGSQRRSVPDGGELKKDPVCGTYVSASASITEKVDGQLVHFCSEECRKRYCAA